VGIRPLIDPDTVKSQLLEFNGNVAAVSQNLGVHKTTVLNWIAKNNIANVDPSSRPVKPSRDALRASLERSNWNVETVAKELNASPGAVWGWKAEYNLQNPNKQGPSKEDIEKSLQESNNNVVAAAKNLHVAPSHLYELIRAYSIVRPPKNKVAPPVKPKKMRVPLILRDLYERERREREAAKQQRDNSSQSQDLSVTPPQTQPTQDDDPSTGTTPSPEVQGH
jgi:hypothetical protein